MQTAFFLPGRAGQLFCTASLAEGGSAGPARCLILPPFAEEMNKSRHVLASLVRRLAVAGCDALLLDPFGTGDSAGDFAEATMEVWRDDIDRAIGHLGDSGPLHLVGLRHGALLAADATGRHQTESLTLLHPLIEGRQQLMQMLRLRLAAALGGDAEKESTGELKQRLADGETLEIAGYRLSGVLAADLQALSLPDTPPAVMKISWIEAAAESTRPLMPASQRVVERWSNAGLTLQTDIVPCDAFWTTQEIAQCPLMVDRAVAAIMGESSRVE